MTIIYRDNLGIVQEDLDFNNPDMRVIDFCDGYVYFVSSEIDKDGNYVDKKIPLDALVRIGY